jgi:putative transposase
MKEIVETRVRYGSPRVYTLLRREGYYVNHKRVERIYREQGYSLRNKRPRRRVSPEHRSPKGEGTRLNEVWAMDFVSDALFNGRRIRALTVVDTFSREALAINVGTKLTGLDVIDTLEEIAKERGLPERIKSDNGT